MNREEKQKEIERLRAELSKAQNVFIMGFEKMPVSEDWALRRQVRSSGGQYHVVKNTLASIAGKSTPSEKLMGDLAGPTALAIIDTNPVALAKVLSTYAKANPNFVFRAGLVEGRVVSLAEITALALLPSKEELLAKVLYLISSPARAIAGTLQTLVRNMASVLDQAVKENKFKA